MNIEKMTNEQKFALLDKLNKSLGFYPILVLTVEDVRDHLWDAHEANPSDEDLHRACSLVGRYYDIGNDGLEVIHWAAEEAIKLSEQTQKTTFP